MYSYICTEILVYKMGKFIKHKSLDNKIYHEQIFKLDAYMKSQLQTKPCRSGK